MDEIEIVDYDPRWPTLFDEEAKRLRATLDPSLIMDLSISEVRLFPVYPPSPL